MNSTADSDLWGSLIGLRALFYIGNYQLSDILSDIGEDRVRNNFITGMIMISVPPSEAVEDVEDVPDYTKHAIPWFYGLIAIDILVGYLRSNLSFEPRDSMASITAGVMSRITALLGERSLEMGAYIWAYNK